MFGFLGNRDILVNVPWFGLSKGREYSKSWTPPVVYYFLSLEASLSKYTLVRIPKFLETTFGERQGVTYSSVGFKHGNLHLSLSVNTAEKISSTANYMLVKKD